MIKPMCAVDVGSHEGPYWEDVTRSDFIVCELHKNQYNERPDLGPYSWKLIDIADILRGGGSDTKHETKQA